MRPEHASRRSTSPILSTTTVLCAASMLGWSLAACGPLDGEPWAAEEGPVWASVDYEPDYPHDREHCWSHEAQGVTHDEDSWYISTRDQILKYHVTADLGQCGYTRNVSPLEWRGLGCPGARCRCGHFGDITFHDGLLYAPQEDCYAATDHGETRIPDRLFVYDRDLKMVNTATFDAQVQDGVSWVAVQPVTGEIYSSDFDASHLNVYSPSFRRHAPLRLVRRIDLRRAYRALQGAAFDDSGVLYLVSGDTVQPERAGIYLFAFTPAGDQAALQQFIPPNGYRPGFGYWNEMEGITVWDVRGGNAPGITGQIHWLMLDNDADQDDVYFKHISVSQIRP